MNPELQRSLERAGRIHLRHRVLGIALRSVPWLVALIALIIAIDILAHLPSATRAVLRGLFLLLVPVLLATAAGIALFRRTPILRTARMLEEKLPELDSRLINLLQLEGQAADPATPDLTRALARRALDDAARDLPLARLAPAARPPRLARRFALAAIAPALLALATLVSGEWGAREWARLLDPHGDHPPLSFTRLAIVDPAEDGTAVAYREGLEITVQTSGHRPKEVFLTGLSDSGENRFTLPMFDAGEGRFSVRVEDLREPLDLYAHTAGEHSLSKRRRVEVLLDPRIARASVTVTPPAYTGRPPQRSPFRFAGLRALAGSTIEFEIESNRPLGPGRLIYEIPGTEPAESPLAPADDLPPDRVGGTFEATRTGRLVFHIEDIDGRAAADTPASSLTVTHDAAPSATLLFPTEDTFVVETMVIELIAEAADDIGLRSMRLHVGIDGEFDEPETARFDSPGEPRHRLTRTLDLAAMGLSAGQTISVFADAMDGAPEPQFTRTEQRVLTLITEDQYNEFLRREADVALIAGKYEELLDRLHDAIEEQESIERQLAAAGDLPPDEADGEIGEAFARQQDLNRRLEDIARAMREIPRDNPVYDFEEELGEALAERADQIDASVATNRADLERSLDESAADTPVTPAEREALERAAREQRERLEGERDQAEQEVREPLEDLAGFHEMLKNFNQLRHLAERQRELADQAAASDRGQPLTPEDKAALRDLANRQRELGQRLQQLEEKLRQDAERMRDDLPEMAEAAEQLADRLNHQGLPGQARDAAGEMLDGDAPAANRQARNLQHQLEQLLDQVREGGQPGEQEIAGMLQGFGMPQANNFQQLLESLRFTPPGMGQAAGGSGMGLGGMQAQGGPTDGQPQAMLGGESLRGGDIARNLAGGGGGAGTGGGPGVTVETTDLASEELRSARRTDTPESAMLMMEYEEVADAYFQRLTTPNPASP